MMQHNNRPSPREATCCIPSYWRKEAEFNQTQTLAPGWKFEDSIYVIVYCQWDLFKVSELLVDCSKFALQSKQTHITSQHTTTSRNYIFTCAQPLRFNGPFFQCTSNHIRQYKHFQFLNNCIYFIDIIIEVFCEYTNILTYFTHIGESSKTVNTKLQVLSKCK